MTTTTDPRPVPSHCVVRPRYDGISNVMTVEFYWRMSDGSPIDRPHCEGMAVNDRNVPRLVRAFMEEALFADAHLAVDVNGQSYIAGRNRVYGKRINADLCALGY